MVIFTRRSGVRETMPRPPGVSRDRASACSQTHAEPGIVVHRLVAGSTNGRTLDAAPCPRLSSKTETLSRNEAASTPSRASAAWRMKRSSLVAACVPKRWRPSLWSAAMPRSRRCAGRDADGMRAADDQGIGVKSEDGGKEFGTLTQDTVGHAARAAALTTSAEQEVARW